MHRCAAHGYGLFDAYLLGRDIYVMWDKNPAAWAPQNHSCTPNTAFISLNVVALRDIAADEALTIDYATFCDARMTPCDCQGGSPQCRGRIVGIDPMPGHRL